jgi:hypothetical protein
MSASPDYLRAVTEYLTSNGWETSQKQVREGAFLVLGSKSGTDGEKRLLAMVVTATAGSVTNGHLKYLLEAARRQEAETVVVTAEFGIGAQVAEVAKNHDVGTISPDLVTGSDSSAGSATDRAESSTGSSWLGSEATSENEEAADAAEPDETSGLLTRRRLLAGGGIGVVGLFLFGGGGSESDSPTGGSGSGTDSSNGYDVAAVKADAKAVPYEELFRNIEQYTGERVFYGAAEITQVVEQNSQTYQFRLNVTQNGQVWEDDVLGRWSGERFLEGDLVEFWGVVNGAYQYEAVMGNQRTIPDFDVVDMALIEEPSVSAGNVEIVDDQLTVDEGEFSDEISVVGTLRNDSRLNIGYVEATASLVDAAGDELASNYVNTTGIEAGGSWDFEIGFYGEAEADAVDAYEVGVRELQ